MINVIKDKKILVVGAGNAGRPAANLLNYLGNSVRVSDSKDFNSLPKKAKNKIKELEKKGIVFELGTHIFDSVLWADAIFVSPNIPYDSDIRKFIKNSRLKKDIKEITTSDIGEILNNLIKLPMIGIAGTDGKTTTTNMINQVMESESFRTLVFSSLQDSLVIEGLVDMVVNEENQSKDFAIFELPHGTIRMAQGLELCAGVVTNLTPDHMDEFKSYEEYIDRNFSIKDLIHSNGVLVANGNDPIISQQLDEINTEYILYGLGTPQTVQFDGKTYSPADIDLDISVKDIKLRGLDGSSFKVISNAIPTAICTNCGEILCNCGNFQRKILKPFNINISLNAPGLYNIENAISTMATTLVLGFELDYIKNKLESFKGVKGRFEKIDNVNGVNIFMDAAHNPESMEKLFEGLKVPGRLIVSLDNPDTLTVRDKFKIGTILGKNADVVIASAKNETTEIIDIEAAQEVALGSRSTETYLTENVDQSISKALDIAVKGDIILHIGPGVVNAYSSVKEDIIKAIKIFEESNGKVVVIGGCGTVGSLMARVLKQHGADVTISDSATDTPLREVFTSEGIHLDLGGHSDSVIMEAETIVMAPSLMENQTLLENIKSLSNAPIISVDEILSFFKVEKPVVGITGTNGKTTTTQMLKNILKVAGMSVPEHFMNMQGNTELIPALQSRLKGDAAVVEIGTFGLPGEIKNSALNCEVALGVITNISRDHLRGENDFNEYIMCKREMVDAADILILNADDPLVADFAGEIHPDNVIFYGIKDMESDENSFPEGRECPECENILKYKEHYLGHLGDYRCMCDYKRPEIDVYATNVTENSFKLNIGSNTSKIHLKTGGTCNVYNALAAASTAMAMGVDFDDIVMSIEQFEGVEGRFEKICNNPEIIIDYAHNPAGVKAAIQTIKTSLKSRLIVINTISSESGLDGDREIAQILNTADIVVPASFMAKEASNIIKRDLIFTKSSNEQTKIGTLGANKKQVFEALNKALRVFNDNDIILIIGEGGVKYSKEILEEISI